MTRPRGEELEPARDDARFDLARGTESRPRGERATDTVSCLGVEPSANELTPGSASG